jgi:hypothetical protein
MRLITYHHDGHGLSESILVEADDLDPNAGLSSNHYVASINGAQVARIQFQHGPRDVEGSTPGILDSVLIGIVIDRLRCFQGGPFPSDQNREVLRHLWEALFWMKNRADERAARGVLGRAVK